MELSEVEQWDRGHLWRFRAGVWRVIDGDTFVALPDCGFRVAAFPHIRLLDVYAPELHEDGGEEARDTLAYLLSHTGLAYPWNLRIESKIRETIVSETTTFERYVAVVWVVTEHGKMLDIREML